MKKSTTRRLLMLALCLTLVSCTLIGGTLAKYSSSFEGTGTATAEGWAPTVKIGENDLTASASITVADIYPGMNDQAITLTIANVSNLPASAKVEYTITAEDGATKPDTLTLTAAENTVAIAANESEEVVLTLAWAFDGEDEVDTAFQGKSVTITITVTVDQTQN